MKRIGVLVGVWLALGMIADIGRAVDPKKTGNQGGASQVPLQPPHSTSRYGSPGGSPYNARRSAAAQRAAQSTAAQQAAAHNSSTAIRPSASQPNRYQTPSPGYAYGGYYPHYSNSYSPYSYFWPGTTPYVLGYNPWTGSTYFYPYGSSGYSSLYPYSAYQYPYYGNSYLGYGYPAAVFVPAGALRTWPDCAVDGRQRVVRADCDIDFLPLSVRRTLWVNSANSLAD